jgi:hypothetical protein
MDDAKVAEGNNLYTTTKNIWELNKKEDTESGVASNSYKAKFDELESIFDKVKQFYSGIKNDPPLQAKMDVIKITSSVVDSSLAIHAELLAERSNFDKELSESQDTTKSKNAALMELKEWIEDFDAIAKIALYDNPQLFESLGIFVRS